VINIILSFVLRAVKSASHAALTPVLEKNIVKTAAMESSFVVSMSRLIAMAFAVVLLRDFWYHGLNGWPDAALGITTVLAVPLMNTIQRANPDEVLAVTRLLLARLEPSKYDDHRTD
jgi:hypothetical protein